jgi:hypothetical protein
LVDVQASQDAVVTAPGVATRAFALQCLLALVQSMARDAARIPVMEANLQAVVECAFGVVEDKVDSLKNAALALLACVLATFAGAPDPQNVDDDGAMLMDAFAAPYVTALKTCLGSGSGASPVVTQAAMLAAGVMTCGMLRDDARSTDVRFACPFPASTSKLFVLCCAESATFSFAARLTMSSMTRVCHERTQQVLVLAMRRCSSCACSPLSTARTSRPRSTARRTPSGSSRRRASRCCTRSRAA